MQAQIRVVKIKTFEGVTRADIHNNRTHEEHGYMLPLHIDNPETSEVFTEIRGDKETYAEALQERFDKGGIKPRKDGVIALEYVVSMSTDFWESTYDTYDQSAVLTKQLSFISNLHGAENIIATAIHLDESSPHMHILVAPIIEKSTKRFPELKQRLCAKDFVGGAKKLSKIQSDFYNHCNSWTKGRLGIELTKHTPVAEQRRKYEEKTNTLLGSIRNQISNIKSEITEVGIEGDNAIKEQKRLALRLKLEKEKFDETLADIQQKEKDFKRDRLLRRGR